MELLKGSPIAAFLVALAVTLLLTPLVKRLGWRFKAVAVPDARRKHPEPIALWGGLAVFGGVLAAAILWRQPMPEDLRLLAPSGNAADVAATFERVHLTSTFLITGFLMVVLGLIDDRWELSPLRKMGGQILIIAVLWYSGVQIRSVPFTGGEQPLEQWASFLVTLIWILGLVNAVNFIDGVDGLAAGRVRDCLGEFVFGVVVNRELGRRRRRRDLWGVSGISALQFSSGQDFSGRYRLDAAGLLAGDDCHRFQRQSRRRHDFDHALIGNGRAGFRHVMGDHAPLSGAPTVLARRPRPHPSSFIGAWIDAGKNRFGIIFDFVGIGRERGFIYLVKHAISLVWIEWTPRLPPNFRRFHLRQKAQVPDVLRT